MVDWEMECKNLTPPASRTWIRTVNPDSQHLKTHILTNAKKTKNKTAAEVELKQNLLTRF